MGSSSNFIFMLYFPPGLQNPVDTLYHLQPLMFLGLFPLFQYNEGEYSHPHSPLVIALNSVALINGISSLFNEKTSVQTKDGSQELLPNCLIYRNHMPLIVSVPFINAYFSDTCALRNSVVRFVCLHYNKESRQRGRHGSHFH